MKTGMFLDVHNSQLIQNALTVESMLSVSLFIGNILRLSFSCLKFVLDGMGIGFSCLVKIGVLLGAPMLKSVQFFGSVVVICSS